MQVLIQTLETELRIDFSGRRVLKQQTWHLIL